MTPLPTDLDAWRRIEDDAERLRVERALVADLVDPDHYRATLPPLKRVDDPAEHFVRDGWRQLRDPNPDFDLWWYWSNHLDPADDAINPLVHWVLQGRADGLSTRPPPLRWDSAAVLPTDRPVRRACLLAGYDAEGIVDEAFLILLRELARHADVYCLFDCYLPPEELAKVGEFAVGAWAIRHGAYDFGSYSRLMTDLVGWDTLAEYDEVLCVNDSCFLVRPLDEVFARMDAQACDWWGLQATKGIRISRTKKSNRFERPIPLDRVRDELLATWQDEAFPDFLVASYFLAFRRPVLDDPVFRSFFASIVPQPTKDLVIRKYEIGLTRLLTGHGHRFATFVPDLWPFHPVFTDSAFTLIADEGFPLLKRFFLYANHYDTPGVDRWRERLAAIIPDAPIEVFDENLVRTSPNDRLQRAVRIRRDEDGSVVVPKPLNRAKFVEADATADKDPHRWVFAVDPDTHVLPDNSRALLHRLADHPDVTPVILTRTRAVDLRGVRSLPATSPEGQRELLGAGVVIVRDDPLRSLNVAPRLDGRLVVAVRGGLMLERTGATALPATRSSTIRPAATGRLQLLHEPLKPTVSTVLTASDLDRLAVLAAHPSVPFDAAWRTGIPAHDFLLGDDLPTEVRAQEELLRHHLDGRRLVLLATTRRRPGTASEPHPFTDAEVDRLVATAREAGAVIGVREPVEDLDRAASRAFAGRALDLAAVRFPSLHAVLRATDVLLTDHAGSALDFALTGRPVVAFAPDLDRARERLLLDPERVLPGPVTRDVAAAADALAEALAGSGPAPVRPHLVDRLDADNSRRVIDRIRRRGLGVA